LKFAGASSLTSDVARYRLLTVAVLEPGIVFSRIIPHTVCPPFLLSPYSAYALPLLYFPLVSYHCLVFNLDIPPLQGTLIPTVRENSFAGSTIDFIFIKESDKNCVKQFLYGVGYALWRLKHVKSKVYLLLLTFQSPEVTICTTCCNALKLCIPPTQCICVFRMVLTINSDCFPKQH
jgi:hypothetical protein